MANMRKAVDRITNAINDGQNILVYGDYDVDGTTSVAMMYSFLMEHSERVSFYLPDRYSEGYGVSMQSIDFAVDNEFSLIISLDCGVKAVDQVAYANSKGIDFIICDHHVPGEVLPEAHAILNPLQNDCEYPYKSLSGCGIGFKLIQALSQAWDIDPSESYKYFDYVAIAAACDIVPMTGENRALTHFGLQLMEQSMRPGLKLLLENGGLIVEDKLKRALKVSDLVFVIGPRINAAGRMQHGNRAVELLIAGTQKRAEEPASDIIQNNQDRRDVDLKILDEAVEMIRSDESQTQRKSTVVSADHWHKGVIGIVASRLQDHFYKPTIVMTESNGKLSGSARSVGTFDVHAAIESCSDLLVNYGGHPAAAGITMEPVHLDAFRKRFEEAVTSSLRPEDEVPVQHIDLEISLDQITQRFYDSMNRMAPFGPKNRRPVFVSRHLWDTGNSRCVGDGSHLKLEVVQQGSREKRFHGIAFGMGEHLPRMQEGNAFSLVYTIEENEFRGRKSLELMVKDIRFSEDDTTPRA